MIDIIIFDEREHYRIPSNNSLNIIRKLDRIDYVWEYNGYFWITSFHNYFEQSKKVIK